MGGPGIVGGGAGQLRQTTGRILRHIEEGLACTALVIMTVVAFINVVTRYAFNSPLMWADELNRYLFIWMTYLGAVVATKHKAHIRLEIADQIFRGRPGLFLKFLLHLLMIGTLAVVVSQGIVLLRVTWSTPTAILRIPTGLVYLAVPLCSTLMAGYLVRDAIDQGRLLWSETARAGRRNADA